MKEKIVYEMKSLYRQPLCIKGYSFGEGEKSVCIIGALRGNEVQQLYICSKLVHRLKKLEEQGKLVAGYEILVIPCANPYSMNSGKRFWVIDNTDINRMFPGYDQGETTQRIAAGIFENVKDFKFGIQFTSFYIAGHFLPHVRMMKTGYEAVNLAKDFEMQYAVIRKPKPYDTTTLNYNWQIWNVQAFSIYTNETDTIDEVSADEAIHSTLRFLKARGLITKQLKRGFMTTTLYEEDIISIKATQAGIYRSFKKPGEEVRAGEILAHIIEPNLGKIIGQVRAPQSGIVFFVHASALIMAQDVAYKLIIAED
nr:M14 family metallopeptidase [uncultured Cellulosilyticum sp.]